MNTETVSSGQAFRMLETFATVGAHSFDLTLTTRAGEKVRFQRAVALEPLRCTFTVLFDSALRREQNVIVRPRSSTVRFIQLDDLSSAMIQHVRKVAFLGLETSPGNHQAWVASLNNEADFSHRLRTRTGADLCASGAARVAGSLNFKEKYAPKYPSVSILYADSSRAPISEAEFVQLGLLSDLTLKANRQCGGYQPPLCAQSRPKAWPSYQRCLEGATRTRDGKRLDISRVDFTWCVIAADWGWNAQEVATRLMQESPKAQEMGDRYALLTAERASAVVTSRYKS